MSGFSLLLIAVACTAACILFFFLLKRKKDRRLAFASVPHDKQIPVWLEEVLQAYERQALAYFLHQASLSGDLTADASDLQKKLEIKVYTRPSLLLFEARKKSSCTDSEMEQFLTEFYRKKTGHAMVKDINATYTVQEMLLKRAQNEIDKLQKK